MNSVDHGNPHPPISAIEIEGCSKPKRKRVDRGERSPDSSGDHSDENSTRDRPFSVSDSGSFGFGHFEGPAMCFSAEASFVSSIVLLPVGIYCLRQAWRVDRSFLALASSPVVFGLQQFCEGLVWLAIRRNDPDAARPVALAFLFFALVFWPAWMPWTCRVLVATPIQRWVLSTATFIALFVSLFVYIPLWSTSRDCLHIAIVEHSIQYEFESTLGFQWVPRGFWQIAYVVFVSIPLLIARNRSVRVFGVLVALSSITAHTIFAQAFISVWCLFAAFLSGWLLFLFRSLSPQLRLLRPGSERDPAAAAKGL